MFGARLLPCNRCGAWGTQGDLCAGCGAVTAGESVGLDRCAGDGEWILVERGSAAELQGTLDRLVAEGDPEVRARATAAQRLVRHLAGPGLTLHLDLRPAEAGSLERSGRRANNAELYYVLPWVVVRSERGEARIVRRVHHKVRRIFGAGGVNSQEMRFQLDELWLRAGGGTLRRPLLTPASLSRINLSAADDAPGWGPLPPTAPGGHAPGSLLLGLVAAALLVLAPIALGDLARPTASAVSPVGLEAHSLGAGGVRAALGLDEVWTQRKALAAARDLDSTERRRVLRWVGVDPTRPLDARLQAMDALSAEADGAVAALLEVEATLDQATRRWEEERRVTIGDERASLLALLDETRAVRLACLRGLAQDGRPSRRGVARRAERLLARPDVHATIKRACARLLTAGAGAGRRSALAARLLRPLLADRDPRLRGEAGIALAAVALEGAGPPLRRAFVRTSAAARAAREEGEGFGTWDLALMHLAQALVLSGERDWLRSAAREGGLTGPALQEVERLTQDS